MGGKRKQAQRTKNNARPSSSGRSAELLGSQAPKFVGFGAAKDGGYVAVLPGFSLGGSDVLDPNISPDFQIVLKKMSKKDATTKLKALQEFAELVGGCKEQEMGAVLPFWPRLYSQLAVDAEHRVREAAHQAQLAVVRCMRRNLAPFLRQLIGPWFTSQYDTYGPAASAATLSFQEAFPTNKVPEVIVFCQNEILNYIYDNIIVQKPQTVGNPQVLSKEELEVKYERLLVSSLHGYALYLDTLQPDKLALARNANKKILSCKKFWKYNKHAGAVVRGAWFRAVVALCQRWPDLLEEEVSHVTQAVLGSLDEVDPVVLPAVWEAALHVLTSLKDCWAQVSVEKLVLPKLWSILRQAGHGSAATIFPNLLPLLSRLPDPVPVPQQDRPHFYFSFFSYMRTGFSQRSVQQSISESRAVAKCYVECVRFVLVKYLEKKDFCSDLVENHLVAAVELTLSGECSRVLAEAVHHEVSLVVGGWEQEERYSELRTVFWRALGSCVLGTLRQQPCARTLDHIYLLYCCLQDPSHPRSKQPKHVSFDDNEDVLLFEEPASDPTPVPALLQSLLEESCTACMEMLDSGSGGGGSSHLMTHLGQLLAKFGSERLVTALSSVAGFRLSTPLQWAESTVSRWLSLKGCSPQLVIKVAFVLLETLPSLDQLPLLWHLAQKTQDGPLLVGFLQSVALHHHIPAVASWLAGEGCCSVLLSLAQHTLSSPLSTDARPVMKDILKWTPHRDLLLPVETLESVMRVYWKALSSPWDTLEDVACVGFVCKLVHILYAGDLVLNPRLCSSNICRDLVLLLFDGSCRVDAPYQDLRPDSMAAWAAAVGAMSRAYGSHSDAFRDVLQRFAAVLRHRLFETLEPEDNTVYVAVDAASSLLLCGARDPLGHVDCVALASLCGLLMDAVSCNSRVWQDQAADLCLYALCAAGVLHIPCSYPGLASRSCSAEPGFSRLLVLGLFSAALLVRLCLPGQCHDKGSGSDADTDDDEPFAVQETFIFRKEHILSFLYIFVLGSTFSSHYHSTSYASAIGTKLEALRSYSQKLLKILRSEVTELSAAICTRASEEGGLWLIVNNELLLHADLDLTCINGLKQFGIPHLHAVQMYPRLDATVWCEELPAFMMEMLNSTDVCDATVAVVTSWCEDDGFLGDVDMLQRCSEQAHRMVLTFEEWLQSDRDMSTLGWEEVSLAVQMMNFTSSMLLKTSGVSEYIKEWLSAFRNTCCNSAAKLPSVLLSLLRSLHQVRTKLLVSSAGLRVPLCHSLSQETQFPVGSPDDCKVQVLAIAALRLVAVINKHLCEKGQQPSKSWESGFCEDICTALFQLFLYIAEEGDASAMTCHDQLLLERLADAIVTFDTAMMFRSWDTTRAMQFSCGLLTSTVPQLQQVGYHFLQSLLKQLVVLDARTLEGCVADAGDEVEMARSLSLWQLRPTLEHTQGVMEALLSDFSLGDCCLVRPHTDSFALARAYLFMWDLLFAMCASADTDLRFHYASQLSKQAYVSSLLQILFRLMPEDVIQLKKSKNLEFLQSVQSCSGIELVGSNLTSECLQDWVCLVYLRALQRLPAVVRQWWAGLDSRTSTLVEQVTTYYMSPTLCSLEMDSLQSKNGNMTVHVYGRAREVVARYHVEDVSLELSVVLPSNHPLGPVKVESVNRQSMVEHANWRNWIMQLTVFLAHQNGSLWDGLNLWKSNLDKRFEGIEECYICFSILHGSNFQIPRIRCDTCKKKFHSHCMYKWFDTSNKSTCPICRNFIL